MTRTPGIAAATQSNTPDPARLATVISPLRRALLTASRAAYELPDLPDSHIQVIRALQDAPERTPSELADDLRLDRSTVSNLLAAMERSELIERRPSPADKRRVLVSASPRALELFTAFDRASSVIIAGAVARLDPADRHALASALPALERLAHALAAQPTDPSGAQPLDSEPTA